MLFEVSWVFTSLGTISFCFLPNPRRKSPVSLAVVLLQEGCSKTAGLVSEMFSDHFVAIWSIWWVLGFVSWTISTNYYQPDLYHDDPNGNWGYIEAILELSFCLGGLLPGLIPYQIRVFSYWLITVGSLASGAVCWIMIESDGLYMAVAFLAMRFCVFGLLQ